MWWRLVLTAALLGVTVGGDLSGEEAEAVQVELRQGVAEGVPRQAGPSTTFYSFRGLPYAKPPVGHLRFKDPEPGVAWQGVRQPFNPAPCLQQDLEAIFRGQSAAAGEEDCLYLHVYTPRPYESDLPVMVFIHGGGWYSGEPDLLGGSPLPMMTKNVVLVTIQYRLGLIGFLSTEDEAAPGNLGLKDQTLALRWVRDNIGRLGGDANKITIYGESAGAGSVHLQMFTPASEGLFQRAILQSGTAISPWAILRDHKQTAVKVGRMVGCSSSESEALIRCLREVDAEKFIAVMDKLHKWSPYSIVAGPRVDGQYLPAHPAQLLREGRYHHVSLISGVTRDEGISSLLFFLKLVETSNFADNFAVAGPESLLLDHEESSEYLARRLYHHYLAGKPLAITRDAATQLIRLYTDVLFHIDHELISEFHARDAPPDSGRNIYMYQLEHRPQASLADFFNIDVAPEDIICPKCVNHGDDLCFLSDEVFGTPPVSRPDDVFLSEIMVDLWTNFAATGNPTPDMSLGFRWRPATPSSQHQLSLTPAPTMTVYNRSQIREFHRSLPLLKNKLLYPELFSDNCCEG